MNSGYWIVVVGDDEYGCSSREEAIALAEECGGEWFYVARGVTL